MDQDGTSRQMKEGILKDLASNEEEDVFVPVTPIFSPWNSNVVKSAYLKPEDCLKHLSAIIEDPDTSKGIRVNAIKTYLEKYEEVQQALGNTSTQKVDFTFNVVHPKHEE